MLKMQKSNPPKRPWSGLSEVEDYGMVYEPQEAVAEALNTSLEALDCSPLKSVSNRDRI